MRIHVVLVTPLENKLNVLMLKTARRVSYSRKIVLIQDSLD